MVRVISHRIRAGLIFLATLLCVMIFSFALADEVDLPPLYQGESTTTMAIREYQDREAPALGYYQKDDPVVILRVEPQWLYVKKDNVTGYVLRHLVNVTRQLDVSVMPYGAQRIRHVAVVMYDAPLYESPSSDASTLMNLPKDARVSILSINDGWAKIAYLRQFGYVYMAHLRDLEPVSYDANAALPGQLIASFTTAYSIADNQLNIGRMNNIEVACNYMRNQIMRPGETISFNKWLGPYSGKRGYMEAPILINGTTMPGFGGGTCQVSTTLYNALLPLRGMTIVYRRAHGPNGAAYVPHGVDAAVGNATLDLVFRNDYDFPIMFETWAGRGILFIGIYKIQ